MRHSSATKSQDHFALPAVSMDINMGSQHTPKSDGSKQEEMQGIIKSHNEESVLYPGVTETPTVDISSTNKVLANTIVIY